MTGESTLQFDRMREPLGILAGGGDFPCLVAAAAVRQGRPVFIFGIVGEASPSITQFQHVWVKRGQLGALFRGLKQRNIRDLVMIGGIRERRMPRLSEIDFGGLWSVLTHLRLLARGDDGVLRRIARLIEAQGVRLVGAADVAPDLTLAPGMVTAMTPSDADWRDIDVGLSEARAHGARDLGQAVIVVQGAVLLREGRDGTDALLKNAAGRAKVEGPGGVLVKCLKPNQDRRFDMPAIGPETAAGAIRAGLRGIVITAGSTLVVDLATITARLDAAGLFLVAVPPEGDLSL